MTEDWRPTSTIATLQARAKLLSQIRHFFGQRDVLEVETPAMSQSTVTDVHLHAFTTRFVGPGFANGIPLYLVTSPEFHMKRLLAAGSGAIFQISKAFRNEEAGRVHNPEFTMLEWYRPHFDHHALMDEMDELLQTILKVASATRMTYQDVFIEVLGTCPLESSMDKLKAVADSLGLSDIASQEQDRDTLLQLLFCIGVEPKIGQKTPCFIYNFPASQAALARVCVKDPRVAARFEVYYQGIELANGFYELDNADEQLARFEDDNRKREKMTRQPQPIDNHLLEAIRHGLPDCAGVAVGIDRLIMLALGKTNISEVIAFPVGRA